MRVTIKDVAEKAGVAPSTVSRVIHENPKISVDTQVKVKQAMDELGYHPNAAARSLARGRTHTLGLIIPNSEKDLFVKPFFIRAMRGLSIEAQRNGYNIMFSFSNSEEEEVLFLKRYVRQNVIDGVILMTSRENDKCMAFLEEKEFPYVVIGRPENQYSHALWVDNDNFQAMYNMVNYFLSMGYKNIAFIGGPEGFSVTRDRLRGYREALRTHGIDSSEALIRQTEEFEEEQGYKAIAHILSSTQPDCIAAADDSLAMGALKWMDEHNRYIPIAGFNNTTKGEFLKPSLTTVDIQPEELGTRAASLLIQHLDDEEAALRYSIVDTLLIERESTSLPKD